MDNEISPQNPSLPFMLTLIPPTPHRAFRQHKGDYTGAKILRDQLINAIFKARIYMSWD